MISIERTKDHHEYSSDTLVVVAKHTMKKDDVFKMIDLACEAGMREEILQRLGVCDGREYMVSRDGGKAPTHIHRGHLSPTFRRYNFTTLSPKESAIKEARRLAEKDGGTYRVLRLEKTIRVKQVAIVEEDPIDA